MAFGAASAPPRRRFGCFEVDFRSGELRRRGARIAVQEKPLRVLQALLERPGQVTTRDELRHRLWSDSTFVDFDHGINIAVSKLRRALGDSESKPRFVETLARHGYRFLAPVQPGSGEAAAAPDRILLAVLPFTNLDGDPARAGFLDGLTEEMTTQLGRIDPRRLGVIARMTATRYKDAGLSAGDVGKELGVDYLLEGSARQSGDRVRITAQLIHAADQTHRWADTYDGRLANVFDVQRRVARRIARSVQRELLVSSRRPDTIGAE